MFQIISNSNPEEIVCSFSTFEEAINAIKEFENEASMEGYSSDYSVVNETNHIIY